MVLSEKLVKRGTRCKRETVKQAIILAWDIMAHSSPVLWPTLSTKFISIYLFGLFGAQNIALKGR
jgi:hypothetical protein